MATNISADAKEWEQDYLDVRSRKRISRCARLLWRSVSQSDALSLHSLSTYAGHLGHTLSHLRALGCLCLQRIQATKPKSNAHLHDDLVTFVLCSWPDTSVLHLARSIPLLIRRSRGDTGLFSDPNHLRRKVARCRQIPRYLRCAIRKFVQDDRKLGAYYYDA